MDGQLAIVRFYFFFNIIPIISGRWEEDNIKLCALEPLLDLYMYCMYQVRGRQLVYLYLGGGGGGRGGGEGW